MDTWCCGVRASCSEVFTPCAACHMPRVLAGVALLAYDVRWEGGRAFLGKQLPVVFDPSVNAEYDPVRLQEVLHFNATDPRKNWKSSTKATKAGGGGKGKGNGKGDDEVEEGVKEQVVAAAGKAKARGGRKARGRKVEADGEEAEEQAEGEEDGDGAEGVKEDTRAKRARRGGGR